MSIANVQSKYWCFTVNNPTDADVQALSNLEDAVQHRDDPRGASYIVLGREVGDSGTPHIQGYIEFAAKIRGARLQRLLGGRAHVERRRGTAVQASLYCKKDSAYTEHGELSAPQQGRRTDLEGVFQRIKEGQSFREIADAAPQLFCQYRRGMQAYRELLHPPRHRPDLRVSVLIGEPGTGKTRYVYRCSPRVFKVPSHDLRWFDGYDQERCVLLDDYRGDGSPSFLLQLLDVYPTRVPVKGGFVAWNPDRIWITSNLDFTLWHEHICAPLRRRLRHVHYVNAPVDFDSTATLLTMDEYFEIAPLPEDAPDPSPNVHSESPL